MGVPWNCSINVGKAALDRQERGRARYVCRGGVAPYSLRREEIRNRGMMLAVPDEGWQGRHCNVPGLGAGGEGGEVRTSWRGEEEQRTDLNLDLAGKVYSLHMWWFGKFI